MSGRTQQPLWTQKSNAKAALFVACTSAAALDSATHLLMFTRFLKLLCLAVFRSESCGVIFNVRPHETHNMCNFYCIGKFSRAAFLWQFFLLNKRDISPRFWQSTLAICIYWIVWRVKVVFLEEDGEKKYVSPVLVNRSALSSLEVICSHGPICHVYLCVNVNMSEKLAYGSIRTFKFKSFFFSKFS